MNIHGGLGPSEAENLEVLADIWQAVLTPTNAHTAPPIKKSKSNPIQSNPITVAPQKKWCLVMILLEELDLAPGHASQLNHLSY